MTQSNSIRAVGSLLQGCCRAAAISLLLAAPSAHAQEAKPLATIDGVAISEEELSLVAEDMGDQIARFPAEQRQTVLLDVIINMKLLAMAAREAGLDDSDDFKARIAFQTERTLRDLYFTEQLANKVNDEAVKARYEEAISKIEPAEEVKASHILLKTEDEAKEVVTALEAGKDFAELAKEKSIDPAGKSSGGDLGYFTKDRMVPEFAEAAFALEVGKVSAPVQSQFGWHVIKVEDKRKQPAPPFEEVKDQVRQMVMREKLAEVLEGLKSKHKVEIMTPPPADTAPAAEPKKN